MLAQHAHSSQSKVSPESGCRAPAATEWMGGRQVSTPRAGRWGALALLVLWRAIINRRTDPCHPHQPKTLPCEALFRVPQGMRARSPRDPSRACPYSNHPQTSPNEATPEACSTLCATARGGGGFSSVPNRPLPARGALALGAAQKQAPKRPQRPKWTARASIRHSACPPFTPPSLAVPPLGKRPPTAWTPAQQAAPIPSLRTDPCPPPTQNPTV